LLVTLRKPRDSRRSTLFFSEAEPLCVIFVFAKFI
jgi:hypothetical protein